MDEFTAVNPAGVYDSAPHHPDCPNLSVPDVMVFCWTCGGVMKWCGCRYRCKECES